MNFAQWLVDAVCEAFAARYGASPGAAEVQLQATRKDFSGEATVVVFPLTRYSRLSPEATARHLGDDLQASRKEVASYTVVKGFLNISFSDAFWLEHLQRALESKRYGHQDSQGQGPVLVEYASPNTNKPLHLGHLRNIFLGDAVARILQAAGHQVYRVQIINDRGIHICKSMLAWKRYGSGETPQSSGLKGDHLVGKYYVLFDKEYKAEVGELIQKGHIKEEAEDQAPIMREARAMLQQWEQGDKATVALWEKMNSWVYEGFAQTYARMGVEFDKLYYESETYTRGKHVALQALQDGHFYQKTDGSIWVDLESYGLDHKLILRKDGTAVYITQDIGTAIIRHEEYPGLSRMVYTVGNEQEHHFKVLFAILDKLGYSWASRCHHLSYGMVELPEGKMKSREGTVVDADELMAEMVHSAAEITESLGKLEGMSVPDRSRLFETIGLGALKYFLLKVDPKKNMLFNPAESIDFNGSTGPFIQYAYARIQSVLRQTDELPRLTSAVTVLDAERTLHLRLARYGEAIALAAQSYDPSHLAHYVYELAREFASFYQNHSILKADTEAQREHRLLLASLTGKVIEDCMQLLGMQVPERM